MNNDQIIFAITVEDLQEEAVNRIGRKLADDELYAAKKGIGAGLSFNIDTVIKTAIEESIKN